MKTKMMMTLALILANTTAMAADQTSLTYTRNSGTLAAGNEQTLTCQITANFVSKTITTPTSAVSQPLITPVKWTSAVPSAIVLQSLISESLNHSLLARPGPMFMGGFSELFTGSNDQGTMITLLKNYAAVAIQTNPSTAAQELVQFMNKNCK